jgi:hypothetical protein
LTTRAPVVRAAAGLLFLLPLLPLLLLVFDLEEDADVAAVAGFAVFVPLPLLPLLLLDDAADDGGAGVALFPFFDCFFDAAAAGAVAAGVFVVDDVGASLPSFFRF